uniref:Uncharacterized protein n=1 Tax=Arundo donax TaxID=35708 RepID=A0A0A9AXI5_ARUDO
MLIHNHSEPYMFFSFTYCMYTLHPIYKAWFDLAQSPKLN